MKEPFIIEVGGHRVRIWPFDESVVGIEFFDRPPPPPFPGFRPKDEPEQKKDVSTKIGS